ncbi:unnamed protein product [Hyaloperonospora brassicae]|uniref:RxLR effector candidate protein n=1 Tax=Hyaloperonospora brassicae TaxID=162125 RepID=A0AAV0TEN6_HYABA|nr:unnamed protein product [Hyaloperonospora brassicae]
MVVSLPFFPTLWYWTPSAFCGFHRPFVGHPRRQEAIIFALLWNEVVVFGGRTERNSRRTVHILDTDDRNWKTVQAEGKAPSARTYDSAIAVGDKIVYFGGNSFSNSFNVVYVFQKEVEETSCDRVWTRFSAYGRYALTRSA